MTFWNDYVVLKPETGSFGAGDSGMSLVISDEMVYRLLDL